MLYENCKFTILCPLSKIWASSFPPKGTQLTSLQNVCISSSTTRKRHQRLKGWIFFLQHLKIKVPSWPQNLFSSLGRPSVSVGGTYKHFTGQTQQWNRNSMTNPPSTGQTRAHTILGVLGSVSFERQAKKKGNPYRWTQWHFLHTIFFRKTKPSSLFLAKAQVTLYQPCELIIDSRHFTCK